VSGHGRHAVCAYGGADVYMDHAKGDAAREHIDVEGRVDREHICLRRPISTAHRVVLQSFLVGKKIKV